MPTVVSPNNWLDDVAASITASSAASTLPVASLRTQMLAEIWRATSGTATLFIDLGVARSVRVVAFCAPRTGLLPLASGTINARLSASAIGGTDLGSVTTSAAMPRGYWCWVLPTTVQARYLQVTITSGQSYVQGGRLWVGDGLVTRDQDVPGHATGLVENGLTTAQRTVQFGLSLLPQADADALEAIALDDGTTSQVMVIPRVARADYTALIGKFTRAPLPVLSPGPLGRRYAATIAVQEDR